MPMHSLALLLVLAGSAVIGCRGLAPAAARGEGADDASTGEEGTRDAYGHAQGSFDGSVADLLSTTTRLPTRPDPGHTITYGPTASGVDAIGMESRANRMHGPATPSRA